jgi:hypothetical protein
MPPVRRLAAILAADVAGYSRLMGMDEGGSELAAEFALSPDHPPGVLGSMRHLAVQFRGDLPVVGACLRGLGSGESRWSEL